MTQKKKPSSPATGIGADTPCNNTETTYSLQDKIKIVELVEVVVHAGKETTQAAGGRKQYINLDASSDPGTPHPEFGRIIRLKARVEWATANVKSLSGQTVYWYSEPGGSNCAKLTGGVKEGFGSGGGAKTSTASTDEKGWTSTVQFYLSRYGGDTFMVAATEDAACKGGLKTGTYEVWRKFWYQVTRASSHTVPAPEKSVAAYKKVYAEMLAAAEVEFAQKDAPAGTFYPGWMVAQGGPDASESVIGGHNWESFCKKFKEEKDKPVKGHLIICQHQWDPAGASALLTVVLNKKKSDELTFNLGGAWNAGIVKPALSGKLVSAGVWSGDGKTGALSDADILIEKGRSALNVVKVLLPAGTPDPTKTPVTVKLKLNYGKFYAGESNKHHMLIVYNGAEKNFNQMVAHEFGHGFGQTPRKGAQPSPLPQHPKQYDNEHGGVGSHCSTDATLVTDPNYPKKRYQNGTCIMFHQVNPSGCKQEFCATCEPYLRLQDFSSLA